MRRCVISPPLGGGLKNAGIFQGEDEPQIVKAKLGWARERAGVLSKSALAGPLPQRASRVGPSPKGRVEFVAMHTLWV